MSTSYGNPPIVEIGQTIAVLEQNRIALPRPSLVGEYLARHPRMAQPLLVACTMVQTELGGQSRLSLDLYQDDEIDDEYLTLYVRQEHYTSSLMNEIEAVSEKCRPALAGVSGRLLITTDFRKPE